MCEYSLSEYTGSKDVKKKKIFEGDVLKDESGLTSVVVYEDNSFVLREYHDESIGDLSSFPGKFGSEHEIVGNIYDIIEKEENN